MNLNFAKIPLQKKQQGFGVLFDPTGEEQHKRAVTALDGVNLKAKNTSRSCCMLIFCLLSGFYPFPQFS